MLCIGHIQLMQYLSLGLMLTATTKHSSFGYQDDSEVVVSSQATSSVVCVRVRARLHFGRMSGES